jgi:hypothetical protein
MSQIGENLMRRNLIFKRTTQILNGKIFETFEIREKSQDPEINKAFFEEVIKL